MSREQELRELLDEYLLWAALRREQGVDMAPVTKHVRASLSQARTQARKAKPPARQLKDEPNELDAIRALRPPGPRKLEGRLSRQALRERLKGAWLGRAAGCTLGAPVENWPVASMERLAASCGMPFPPEDYWRTHPAPFTERYGMDTVENYLARQIRYVPVDDDLAYTILGLLILERYGPDFTTENVAAAWLEYLPMACTAEHAALENLRAGVPADKAGAKDNPYQQWIGAGIRCDPWAYACPGHPERAAEWAWRDARLSHRQNGIYGAMFFAAAISAAFAVDTPVEALRIGLTEIPKSCRLARDVRWALRKAPPLRDWREARTAVDERFPEMSSVHTNNNACLTVFGLVLGEADFTRTVGITVAMGLDNDCTAATAGSLLGAVIGARNVPEHWWVPFQNRTRTYLKGQEWFSNGDIIARFLEQATISGRLSQQGRAG